MRVTPIPMSNKVKASKVKGKMNTRNFPAVQRKKTAKAKEVDKERGKVKEMDKERVRGLDRVKGKDKEKEMVKEGVLDSILSGAQRNRFGRNIKGKAGPAFNSIKINSVAGNISVA